jgi:hypothetical protein
MARRIGSILAALFIALNTAALAQVTTRLQSSDPNFKLAGVYLGSTVYTADVFSLFETNGIRRFAWQPDGTLIDVVTPTCSADPQANSNPACGDQIGLFWKHVSCQQWYVPCGSNDRWNGYSGQNNLSTYPSPTTWPPVSGFDHRINYQNLNAVLNTVYPNGLPTGNTCQPLNPGSRPGGAAAPKVVFHSGLGKYFMAFNANINATNAQGQPFGTDNWRVVWAVSTDAVNWTIYPGYLFRSVWEQSDCSGGFQVLDLLIDGGYFYLLVESPDSFVNGQPQRTTANQLYLLRTPIGSGTYGFTSWYLASYPIIAGEYSWTPITLGVQQNFESSGYPIMRSGQWVNQQAAISQVFSASTPNSPSRYIGISSTGQGPPYLHTWSTTSLSKPFENATLVDNLIPNFLQSEYGWFLAFTHYPDNVPSSPRVVGTGFDLWMVAQEGSNRVITHKVTATLSGDIFGAGFYTVTPCRIADTRNPTGPLGGPALNANSSRIFSVAAACGIPVTAKAISANVTITQPTSSGSLTLYPANVSAPQTYTINYSAGQTRANNSVMSLSPTGTLGVRCTQTSGTTHFILDVNGYFQ